MGNDPNKDVRKMLQGSLDNFTLAEVLGLLSNTEKTGKLALTGDRGHGSLWFSDGMLVASEAANSATDAPMDLTLFELLRFQSGTFAFESEGQAPETTQEPASVDSVLSTAEARMVEWVDIEAIVPSVWHRLTPAMSLPASEVTITAAEWDMLIAVGETSTVGAVSDRLDLDEFDGSKRVMQMLERSLIEIAEPATVQKGDPLAGLTEQPALDEVPEVVSAADAVDDLQPEVVAQISESTPEPAPIFAPAPISESVPAPEAAPDSAPVFEAAPTVEAPVAEPAPVFEPAPVADVPPAFAPPAPAPEFEPGPVAEAAPAFEPAPAPVAEVPEALQASGEQPTSAEELFALVVDHDNASDVGAPPNGADSPFAVDNGLLGGEAVERSEMPPAPTPPSPAEIDSFSSQISDSSQIVDPDAPFDPTTFDPASLVVDDEEDSVLMKFLKTGE